MDTSLATPRFSLRAVLDRAGRHGPALLCFGVLTGLAAPALAELARPLMGLAVFLFTLGAFLKVDAAAFRTELLAWRAVLAVLLWSLAGVPLLALLLLRLAGAGPDASLGIMLWALAPPVGSAAAIAAMLGLGAPLALLATVAATLLAPLLLPPLAALLAGTALAMDPLALSLRLAVIIGAAAGAAALLRRQAGPWVAANPHAMTAVAVLGLLLVAVGAMRGMREAILEAPGEAATLLLLAFALNAGMQGVGALAFARLGLRRALTAGLLGGNRNVTLVWAAAAPALADRPGVEMVLAMSVFPIFMLPLVQRRPFARLLAGPTSAARPATPTTG